MRRQTAMSNGLQPLAAPQRLALGPSMHLKAVEGRLRTIERVTAIAADVILTIHIDTAEQVEQLVVELERYDTVIARLGEEVALAHQTAKHNAAMRLYQLAATGSAAVQEMAEEALEWLAVLPDGFFHEPTTRERLAAFLRNTHAALEMRPGTPRLTTKEHLKELLWGGVVDGIVTEYDRAQLRARQQARLMKGQQPEELPAAAEDLAGEEVDEDESAADLLKSIRNGRAAEYAGVKR